MAVIVKAKEQAKATPPPPRREIPVTLSNFWNQKDKDVSGKVRGIQKYGPLEIGGFTGYNTTEQLGTPADQSKVVSDFKKENLSGTQKVNASGVDASAKMLMLQGLDEMYDNAYSLGYRTRDQFATVFEDLKDQIRDPKVKAMFKDKNFAQVTSTGGANLKNAAAQHFADLSREYGSSNPTATPTPASATPTPTPAASAPASAAPRLRVTTATVAPSNKSM
jgi:hypothetical protein